MFFRDFNGDGHLDLYVITGSDFDYNVWYLRKKDILYLNDGNGNFQQSLIGSNISLQGEILNYHSYESVGVVTGDFDGDGDIDFFVVTKYLAETNKLHINTGDGTFVGATGGDATRVKTAAQAVVSCDIDGDDDLDIYIRGLPNILLLNDGTGSFTQAADDVIAALDSDPLSAPFVLDSDPLEAPFCFDATGNGQMDLWASKKSLNFNKGNWPGIEATTGVEVLELYSFATSIAHVYDADNDGDMVRSII